MKYILVNDIEYLIKKRKLLILILLIIPLLVLFLNVKSSFSNDEIISICLGNNLNKNSNVLEMIMFIFNIFTYVFIMIDLYIKDITYQLDNIFLRYNYVKWDHQKSIITLCLTTLLKISQYIVLFAFLFILRKNGSFPFKLLLSDLSLTIFLQILFISIYFCILCFTSKKYFIYFIYILIILFIPKNVLKMNMIEIFMFYVLTFILLAMKNLFLKKYYNKLFEVI